MATKILVTGGAGFIGSHLCEKLLEGGYRVVCLDNFNDYYDPKIKENNITNILSHKNFLLVRGDILDIKFLENIFSKEGIERIVHLAAVAGVRPSLLSPALYVDVDIKGTVNLLEIARKYKIKQFIFGSSSSVYGVNSKVPFSEKDPLLLQISPYATAKRAAELYCATYHHLYGIPITIFRFFTVYGPRQRPDMAIHKFTKLMVEGKQVPVFAKGKSERDYTYIDDILQGLMKSIENTFDFEIFNLGNSKTIGLMELIEIISKELGMKPNLKLLPEQQGDVRITYADISKAEKILGFRPKTNIETGVNKFVTWYKELNRDYS